MQTLGSVTVYLDPGPCDWLTPNGTRCDAPANRWVERNLGRYCPYHYSKAVEVLKERRRSLLGRVQLPDQYRNDDGSVKGMDDDEEETR